MVENEAVRLRECPLQPQLYLQDACQGMDALFAGVWTRELPGALKLE